jgi:hypothetical protein
LKRRPRGEKLYRSTGKGGTSWETKAARKTRKRGRNRTPKNRDKKQKPSWISNPKENLDE